MFEVQNIITDNSTQEILSMYRNIIIWNISLITNVKGTADGLWPKQDFSEIIFTTLLVKY